MDLTTKMISAVTVGLLVLSADIYGQTGTISGFVRDSTNSETLSYVNVFVPGTNYGAATDRDGYYVISGLPADSMTVTASIIGYQLTRQQVQLLPGANRRLDFNLAPSVIEGEEVIVSARARRFKEAVEVSTITLTTRDIKMAPAFIEADVLRTLQLLPGVQAVSDYSSALYVRGSTPDQNLILLDGITIYSPFHLGGIFSTFNTDAIKEAEFVAGGFPAKYGGRMGSVLEIINRDGNGKEFSGTVNISLISAKGLVEGPLPQMGPVKGTYMFSVRRTYLDKMMEGAFWALGLSDNPEFIALPYHFWDLQAKANFDVGEKHRFTVSTFSGLDQLLFEDTQVYRAGSGEVGPAVESSSSSSYFKLDWNWGNRANSIAWRWIPTPKLISRVYVARSRFRYGIDVRRRSSSEKIFADGSRDSYESDSGFKIFDLVEDWDSAHGADLSACPWPYVAGRV